LGFIAKGFHSSEISFAIQHVAGQHGLPFPRTLLGLLSYERQAPGCACLWLNSVERTHLHGFSVETPVRGNAAGATMLQDAGFRIQIECCRRADDAAMSQSFVQSPGSRLASDPWTRIGERRLKGLVG
jgi:hypothetical protein